MSKSSNTKMIENIYNNVSDNLKNNINLPTYYHELTIHQKMFFDELIDNQKVKEIEVLKESYKKIITHIDGFVDSLEKVDSILYPIE
jgi:hypothetical protein